MTPAGPAAAPAAPLPPAPPVAAPAFTVGGLVGRTFSTWSRNLVPFAVFGAIVSAPMAVIGLWNNYAVYGVASPSFGQILQATRSGAITRGPLAPWTLSWAVLELAMMLLVFAQMGAFTWGAIQHLAGRRFSIGELLGAGFRRAGPVFLAGLASGLLTLLATLLLVVPGVIVAIASTAAIPAAVAEGKGAMDAVKRSFALTKGKRLALFAALLVVGLAAWAGSAIVALLPIALGGGPLALAGWAVSYAGSAVVMPLMSLLPAVAYHDLRVAKEGVGTAELVKVFE